MRKLIDNSFQIHKYCTGINRKTQLLRGKSSDFKLLPRSPFEGKALILQNPLMSERRKKYWKLQVERFGRVYGEPFGLFLGLLRLALAIGGIPFALSTSIRSLSASGSCVIVLTMLLRPAGASFQLPIRSILS